MIILIGLMRLALASIAIVAAPMAQAKPLNSSGHNKPILPIVSWRLPSKIVVKGNVVGIDRLRALAGDVELQSDSKLANDAEPSDEMKALVATLVGVQFGYLELDDNRISVIGVAEPDKVPGLKSQLEQQSSQGIKFGEMNIGSLEQSPFQWAAYRYKDENDADTIELTGSVSDENIRGKLIGLARGVSDDVVIIDKMIVRGGIESKIDEAAIAGLAQLSSLNDGLVFIDRDKISLLGSSFDWRVSDRNAGCAALKKVLPNSIGCRSVVIVQQVRPIRHHHHNRRGGQVANDEGGSKAAFSKAKPFVATDPRRISTGDSLEDSTDPRLVDILFATSRKIDDAGARLAPSYGGERNLTLNYGRARVRIPEDHKTGRLELPGGFSIFGLQLTQEAADPKRHFILRSREPLTLEQWDSFIDKIGPREAVVFVHGFNTSFDDSVFRFSQIVWDLQYKGLPVLFSWPSRGSVVDYLYDRESALGARDAFVELLANLRDRHKISTVHVIAHSMGNFLVLEALARQAQPVSTGMGRLIMAAPDVDRDQFVQDIAKIKPFFQGLTLYASSADWALALSKRVAGRIPRAGDVPADGPIVLAGLETLDVTALGEEMFGLNHTTFAQARPLIADIALILAEGRAPPRLPDERPMPEIGTAPKYWRFAQ